MDRRRDTFNTKKLDVKDLTKLTLWNSEFFTPIMSHEELETIMDKLGFIPGQILPPPLPLPGAGSWRPYIYTASCRWMRKLHNGEKPPTVKLPYPKIDGLHELTYSAFLDNLKFYLEKDDISTIFHIRSSAVNRGDLQGSWEIEESENGNYIYRPRTLEGAMMKNKRKRNQDEDDTWKKRTRGSSSCTVVPLKDIITIMLKNDCNKQSSVDDTEINVASQYSCMVGSGRVSSGG